MITITNKKKIKELKSRPSPSFANATAYRSQVDHKAIRTQTPSHSRTTPANICHVGMWPLI